METSNMISIGYDFIKKPSSLGIPDSADWSWEIMIGVPFQIRDTMRMNVEFCTIVDIRSCRIPTTSSITDQFHRSLNNKGHLFLPFFLQFSFFLWTKLCFFLLFFFAFVSFSFITHVCFSLFESELCRTVETKPRVRSWRIADKLVWRQCQTRPSCAELHLRTLLWFCQLDSKLPIRTWFKSL